MRRILKRSLLATAIVCAGTGVSIGLVFFFASLLLPMPDDNVK